MKNIDWCNYNEYKDGDFVYCNVCRDKDKCKNRFVCAICGGKHDIIYSKRLDSTVCVGCELIVIKNELLRKQGVEQFADPSFGVHVFANRLKDVAKMNGSVSADDIEQLLKAWDKLVEGRYKRK